MMSTRAESAETTRHSFAVDSEHTGIRTAVFLLFVGSWIVGYAVANLFIPTDGFNLVAVGIGFALAFLVSNIAEPQLKKHWPSNRAVYIDSNGVRIEKRGVIESQVLAEDPARLLYWRFEVQKRTRIPKGWSMLGSAVEIDGRYLCVYTFISPDQLKAFARAEAFIRLAPKKEARANESRQDLRLAGEQRRLREAETHRWMEGAEMSFDDFKSYLNTIENLFPEWTSIR